MWLMQVRPFVFQNLLLGSPTDGEDTVQHDLMTEIQNYDDRLKEKDQTIDKLKQTIDYNFYLVHELQEMNEMFNIMKKGEMKETGLKVMMEKLKRESDMNPLMFHF